MAEKTSSSRTNRIVIAAIDFGTTYSGYAYILKHEFENPRSPEEMRQVLTHSWQSGSSAGLISHKTPTSLLLRNDGAFDSFGYEAEKKYSDLAEKNEHEGWRFFRKFKMLLHENEDLTKNTTISDDQGHSFLAIEVFAQSIRFLKNDLLKKLDRENVEPKMFYENDIQWVLTIPAIWNPQSKEFMRAAAEEAGIDRQQLEFALEPEAASVYVNEIFVSSLSTAGDEKKLVPFEPGTKYLVLDLGGGTIDIVVKEVREDRTLRELHHAFGNGLGGESVNTRIFQYFEKVFGSDVMNEFKTKNKYKTSWLDFETEIEVKKRVLDFDSQGRLKLKISASFPELFEQTKGVSLKEHCGTIEHLSCKRDSLYVHEDVIKELFRPSIDSIIKFLTNILNINSLFGISDVIMVGGFSQCQMLLDAVRTTCSGLRVLVPDDADLAVLKGAVIYRHWPEVIYSRRSLFSVGARFVRAWLDGDDIQKQFRNKRDEIMCKDYFSKFVTKNEEFGSKDKAKLVVYPLEKDTKSVPVMLYKSDEENPRYTTDSSCKALGKPFNVEMSDMKGGLDREVHVTLTMGGTEIRVKGQQMPNGEVKEIRVDLIKGLY